MRARPPRGRGADLSVSPIMRELAERVAGMINAGDAEGWMAIAADNLVFLDED